MSNMPNSHDWWLYREQNKLGEKKKKACGFGKFIIVFWSMFCFGTTRITVIPAQLQMVNIINFHKVDPDPLWITSF